MIEVRDNPRLKVFSVEAMNTTFTLRLETEDDPLAQDAASACFNQLEELESQLSRFRPDSDVSRINGLTDKESLLISELTHACLLKAAQAQVTTAGLFDVTLGAHTWPNGSGLPAEGNIETGQLEVAPIRPLVNCLVAGRQVDLGGIGKGFALDHLALTLASYQIRSALVSAGASTLLAIGPQSWPILLTGDTQSEPVGLQDRALSASGTGIQGAHVMHPDSPDDDPTYRFKRVWLLAHEAALADAYSTACLLMADDEIDSFAEVHRDDLDIYVEEESGKIRTGGAQA